MKFFLRIHPVLLLVSCLMYLYTRAILIASPQEVLRPFFCGVAGLSIAVFPLYYLTRDWDWAFALLSLTVVTFFSSPMYFLFVGLVATTCFVLFFVIRFLRGGSFLKSHLGPFISFLAGLLFFLNIYYSANQLFSLPMSFPNSYLQERNAKFSLIDSRSYQPDIYYIVLDAYGREDILKKYYGFDNWYFLNQLRDRSFVIPEKSLSNYPKTVLSVASTLNMNYIDKISPGLQDVPYWWVMKPLIDKSEVRLDLEGLGYQSVSVATDWGITNNQTTDYYFHPSPLVLNDFEGFILASTPIKYISFYLSKYAILPSYSGHRAQVEYNFTVLKKILEIKGSKFVFIHIIAPHPPFVFDQDGNPVDPQLSFSFADANELALGDEQYRNGYIQQVQYVNKRLIEAIDEILANSKTPPIILLQADHGPGMFTDFNSSESTCLRERFSVFAAYYLPDMPSGSIPENISPVNLFRIIFNKYFNAKLPMLEQFHYFSESSGHIYNFEDVTSEVNTCSAQ